MAHAAADISARWMAAEISALLTARSRRLLQPRGAVRRQMLPAASSDAAPIRDRRQRSWSGDIEGRADAHPWAKATLRRASRWSRTWSALARAAVKQRDRDRHRSHGRRFIRHAHDQIHDLILPRRAGQTPSHTLAAPHTPSPIAAAFAPAPTRVTLRPTNTTLGRKPCKQTM